jgi:chromate transport protein ChrA
MELIATILFILASIFLMFSLLAAVAILTSFDQFTDWIKDL